MAQNEQPKVVNLMEDCGNFHDENELQKSMQNLSSEDKARLQKPLKQGS